MTMTKTSFENKIVNSAITGAGIGAGAAALSALLTDVLETKRQRDKKEKRDKKHTHNGDENTITFFVGKKGNGGGSDEKRAESECADACGAGCGEPSPGTSRLKVEPAVTSAEVRYTGPDRQVRTADGKFSSLNKTADGLRLFSVPSDGAAMAAAVASVPAGYYVVKRIHQKLEENRLKRQISAAQKEYLSILSGESVKSASAFSRMFLFGDGIEKRAGKSAPLPKNPSLLDYGVRAYDVAVNTAEDTAHSALSGLVALGILGTGTVAYITHKILQNKLKDRDNEEPPRQPIKIMLKGASAPREISPEEFLCTIAFMRGCIADGSPMLKSAEQVSEEDLNALRRFSRLMEAQGISPRQGADNVQNYLAGNEKGLPFGWQTLVFRPLLTAAGGDREKLRKITPEAVLMLEGYDSRAADGKLTREELLHALSVDARDKGYRYDVTPDEFVMNGRIAKALGIMDTDPAAVRSRLMEYIKDHQDEWFNLVGSEDARGVRNAYIGNYLSSSNGILNFLFQIPGLGQVFQWIARQFVNDRTVARQALKAMGYNDEDAEKVLKDTTFSENGGWSKNAPAAQGAPAAGAPAVTPEAPATAPTVPPASSLEYEENNPFKPEPPTSPPVTPAQPPPSPTVTPPQPPPSLPVTPPQPPALKPQPPSTPPVIGIRPIRDA